MRAAHDVYSETNPAFCAYTLAAFTAAYIAVNAEGPSMSMAYLALPVALSGDLEPTFLGTNKNTGLLEWLERSPQVQMGLADRLNASMDIVTEAIRFGCFVQIIKIEEGARLMIGKRRIGGGVLRPLDKSIGQAAKRAERLGSWFAKAGSVKTVFYIIGVTV